VDLSVPGGAWRRGIEPKCETIIAGDQEALSALVVEPDRLPEHLAAGRLCVTGNRSKLAALSRFLTHRASPLSLRTTHAVATDRSKK
jgi:hypothetical protein